MKKLLKTLLTYKFRTQKPPHKKSGFTLIELLVGLIMGALIITPLLGFMINVMSSDRQEQAKSASEQEIQTALDYIGRDLSQAIFIYDGWGLNEIKDELPTANGAEPVLVFWKREFIKDALDKAGNATDDAFVTSLVAYYQIKDETCTNTSTWSCTTRISRVQIKDGLPEIDPATNSPRKDGSGNTIYRADYLPSPGFEPLPKGGDETVMNTWESGADISDPANSPTRNILIDFVDQTPFANVAGLTPPACPTTGRATPRPDGTDDPANFDPTTPYPYRQVPNYTGPGAVPASLQTGSFYACVYADRNLAQVFIRGNSLARNSPRNNPPEYSANKSAFFPKANIQVQGSSSITGNSTN